MSHNLSLKKPQNQIRQMMQNKMLKTPRSPRKKLNLKIPKQKRRKKIKSQKERKRMQKSQRRKR